MLSVENLIEGYITSIHGSAVSEQFRDSFAGEPFEKSNFSALKYIFETIENILCSQLLSEQAYDELYDYRDALEEYLQGE